MRNITAAFSDHYQPVQALLIRKAPQESRDYEHDYYVESYDIDAKGHPINAHPLSEAEAKALAKALYTSSDKQTSFLQPEGLLPENVLYIKPSSSGHAIWYTPPQQRQVHFIEKLDIPSGMAHIPGLIWKADKKRLMLFAVEADRKPTLTTQLFAAPFFNVYKEGGVCMGTVDVKISSSISLESFMTAWENYFFNSYFSHTIQTNATVDNIVFLWKSLVEEQIPFPKESLVKLNKTLKSILA